MSPVRALTLATTLVLASVAQAEITDPTRPPAGFGAPDTAQDQPPPLVVNSVFLMGRKPYALVDGMAVRVGDRLGEGRVSRIDEAGVWLKTPAGTRHLKLVPGIDKRPAGQGNTRMEKHK
jgi:hypothetical protein